MTPTETKRASIFLGGSIEMGKATDWQSAVLDHFYHNPFYEAAPVDFYNPRRRDWDASWVQDPKYGTQFHQQVSWEIKHQNDADILVYNFCAGTVSPITLLELGVYLRDPKPKFVVCPKDFARYGNVKLTTSLEGDNIHFYEEICDQFYIDLMLEVQKTLEKK